MRFFPPGHSHSVTFRCRLAPAIGPMIGIVMALATFGGGCSHPATLHDGEIRRLEASIDTLRFDGRYEEALAASAELTGLASQPGARWWQRDDAHRIDARLRQILAMAPDARRDAAEADSLSPVIERLTQVDEDYVAAFDRAARQLELRGRLFGPEDPEAAVTLQTMARIANLAGEGMRCEEYAGRALAIRRARLGARHPQLAEPMVFLGTTLKTREEFVASDSTYRAALGLLKSSCADDDPALAPVLEAMGSFYRLRRRFDESNACYTRALTIRRRHWGDRSLETARNLIWLGYSRMWANRLDAAAATLQEAHDILESHGIEHSHDSYDVHWIQAQLAWLRGEDAKAIESYEAAWQCQSNAPRSHPQGFGLAQLRGVVGEYVDALLNLGRYDEAWAEVCRSAGPATASLMNLSDARLHWPAEAARLDSLRAEVLELRGRIRSATGAQGGGMSYAGDSLEIALARVDGRRMRLEQDLAFRFAAFPEAAPATPDEVQAALAPDQAMIGWVQGFWGQPDNARVNQWAFIVRRGEPVRWVRLQSLRDRREADEYYRRMRGLVWAIQRASQWPQRVEADPELDERIEQASREGFQPLLPYLEGITNLVIARSRAFDQNNLWNIPEAFPDSAGRRMIERFAISYAPSPSAFVRLKRRERSGPGVDPSIVAVADPSGPPCSPVDVNPATFDLAEEILHGDSGPTLISPTVYRGALAGDPAALRRLPPLPDARREAAMAASVFPTSSLLMGPDATPAEIEESLQRSPRVGVLHLATHALVDPFQPERSTLILSSADRERRPAPGHLFQGYGLLSAEDVLLGPRFDIDLVTLSGCQTGLGFLRAYGEELSFAQAFLAAGAHCLLLSRWKVDDQATALLMSRFYQNLTGSYRDSRDGPASCPMSRARALREAQNWLRRWRTPDGATPFAHPVYWAGFMLVGDAR